MHLVYIALPDLSNYSLTVFIHPCIDRYLLNKYTELQCSAFRKHRTMRPFYVTRRAFFAISGSVIISACGLASPARSGLRLAVAASLRRVMEALDREFRQTDASREAQIQSAGSGALAQQIIDGAPFDLFAAADRSAMTKVVDAGIIAAEHISVIAHSQVVIVANAASAVFRSADLAVPGTKVVIADATVPAGRYAAMVLAQQGDDVAAQVRANVVSYEANVTAVLQKVQSGEADAGIVYLADTRTSPDGSIRVILPSTPVQAEYVASLLPNAQPGSQAFLDYLMSATAAPIWHAHGFTAIA